MTTDLQTYAHRFSVAPMMDWTDRYDRFFLRLISRHALLYTEMVTSGAVLHGDRERLLAFEPEQHPVALQLGGSDPHDLAEAARIGEGFGYDEINLNVGCPSDRVQSGRFGACLMAEPETVARCVSAMMDTVSIPVTVKCRIGIDDQDEEAALDEFVGKVRATGCSTYIIHARKAWLEGLSPKQNRDIPPLNYERVYRLKRAHSDLTIVINGGIGDLEQADAHMNHVDGVMLGRAAYQDPFLLSDVDRRYFDGAAQPPTRREIVERLLPYVERKLSEGVRLNQITRHILGLYQGVPGAKLWRRHLSQNAHLPDADAAVVREALDLVSEVMDRRAGAVLESV